jgi:hypothetical protein
MEYIYSVIGIYLDLKAEGKEGEKESSPPSN